jgi:hypothetical protein
MSLLRKHAILAFLWRKQWESRWSVFEKPKILTLPVFPTRDKRRRYCESRSRLFVIPRHSRLVRVEWSSSFLHPARSCVKRSSWEGEKMEIRGERNGERRAINGIRIGRAPCITCRYLCNCCVTCVQACVRSRVARARTCMYSSTPPHDCARGCSTKMKPPWVSQLFLYLLKLPYCRKWSRDKAQRMFNQW